MRFVLLLYEDDRERMAKSDADLGVVMKAVGIAK